uniref:Uncharacterized protein n=1 Tax=viral metagenome TaxID=1070528 RepID=A0A6C0FBF7_9ZZZZ|tara:strand:+ start:6208 stop:6453 length:246 start_codon:yes stop_codon:yes gene_type:complete
MASIKNKSVLGVIAIISMGYILVNIWYLVIMVQKTFKGEKMDVKNFSFDDTETKVIRTYVVLSLILSAFGLFVKMSKKNGN